jgi:hypothetical protein
MLGDFEVCHIHRHRAVRCEQLLDRIAFVADSTSLLSAVDGWCEYAQSLHRSNWKIKM